MPCTSLIFRRPIPSDWERVQAVMPAWWGGRDLRAMLPEVFFEHFRTTSLVVEHEDELVGFLIGFPCADHADEAYVHFAGVHPAWRRAGLGRDLYRRFFGLARARERNVIRAVTGPENTLSIAFHTALGFSILAADDAGDSDGATIDPGDAGGATIDPGAEGDTVVRFELVLPDEEDV